MNDRVMACWFAVTLMGCGADFELLTRSDGIERGDGGREQSGGDGGDAGSETGWEADASFVWRNAEQALENLVSVTSGAPCASDSWAESAPGLGCDRQTVLCTEGKAYPTYAQRSACSAADVDVAGRLCARRAEVPCAIDVWACDAQQPEQPSGAVTRISLPGCENLVDASKVPLTGCPGAGSGDDMPWLPAFGTPCEGTFFCDSYGFDLGPQRASQFDSRGRIYWCENDVLQRAALSSVPPWQLQAPNPTAGAGG